jgi:hypothetical protein
MKLTIFTTLKPFEGHVKIIQTNAIKSWLLLDPKPEIIIFGNSRGSKEIAEEFNLRHIPDVQCSPSGAPYANIIFGMAETLSTNPLMAYLNGDIILNNTFVFAIQQIYKKFSKFLMVGCRWDVTINEYINYENPDWKKYLLNLLKQEGKLHDPTGIDFFVYTRRLFPEMPSFIVGRANWDNGLIKLVSSWNIPIFDVTTEVLAVHQNHDYSHVKDGKDEIWNGKEANHNLKICGGYENLKNISHANWRMNQHGLETTEDFIRRALKIKMNMRMRLLEVHTLHSEYIKYHYQKNPDLQYQPYSMQIQSLINDGICSGNILTPYLPSNNFSSELIIANNPYSQAKWIQEHHSHISNINEWCFESLRKQIEIRKPDILYIADPITFDHAFIKQLKWKPKLIIGWRANFFKPETDLRDYDILISHLLNCIKYAETSGVKTRAISFPGFSSALLQQIKKDRKKWDFVFTGHATQIHKKRNKYLIDLANAYANNHEIISAYFIGSENNVLPSDLPIKQSAPRWGIKMLQEIQRSRIVLNADNDFAYEAGNSRLFEVTGIGSFLLTEYHPNIDELFEPGVEIETFRDSNELIAKVNYYLAHPKEREAIARRGQERCFKDHLIEERVLKFDKVLFGHMKNYYHIV